MAKAGRVCQAVFRIATALVNSTAICALSSAQLLAKTGDSLMCRLRPHSIRANGHMLIQVYSTCDRFNSCLAILSFYCGAYREHGSLSESLYAWHLEPRRHLRSACHTKHDANIAPSDNPACSPCPWRHAQ